MKTFNANQAQKLERPFLQPRYLVHLFLPGETLYFSDRNFNYNGHFYENYLTDIPQTAHAIENSGGYSNLNAQLKFKNRQFRNYSHLIEFFDSNPLVFREAEIFVLYIDTGDIFETDVSTNLYRVAIGEFKSIKRHSFVAEISSIIHAMDHREIFKRINVTDWPNADTEAIGKYENHIYGSIRDVPCHCVSTGAASTLFLNLAASGETYVVLSEVDYPMAFPSSGKIQIDDERMNYSAKDPTNKRLTISARGVDGTTAVIHTRGAPVYLVLDTYKYLIAGHVCKSAANAKSAQIRLDPADYTVNLNDGGKTTISFTEKQILRIQGMHSHPVSITSRKNAYGGQIYEDFPGSWQIVGTEVNLRDQSEDTSVQLVPSYPVRTAIFVVSFEAVTGSIKNIFLCIRHLSLRTNAPGNAGTLVAYHSGGTEVIGTPDYSGNLITQKFLLSTKNPITMAQYVLYQGGTLTNAIYARTHEIWLEYEFSESGVASAEGVYGKPTDVIAPPITIDVEGYQDDGDGTYTGVANGLITNSSDVRRHIIVALFGRTMAEIGTSFDTARTAYAARISGGYKFGFILSRIGEKPSEILKRLDEQSRSNTKEEGGKFELQFNISVPVSVMTITTKEMIGEPVFDQTAIFNIRDKVRAVYDIDWAESSIFTGWKFGKYKKQTQRGTGTKILDLEFPAIQIQAMAEDVADYFLDTQEKARPTVKFDLKATARGLERGDPIKINYPFWFGRTWKILSVAELPRRQVYSFEAVLVGMGIIKYGSGIKYGTSHKYGELIN